MPVIGLSCWERPLDTVLATAERHHLLSSTYTAALVAVGATPVLLPSIDPARADLAVSRIDGLVITGGGDIDPARYGADNTDSTDIDPVRDAWEISLLDAARRRGLPMLGICRGCQILNVGLGGTLRQHVWGTDTHPHLWNEDRTHLATGHHDVALDGALREVYGKDARRVNSLHHQSIDSLAAGLEVVATSPDGRIEAVATTGRWQALGVQWHPERLELSDEAPLFRWITERASGRPRRPQTRIAPPEKTSSPDAADTSITSPSA
jgi:putative glutamine amidotransferase